MSFNDLTCSKFGFKPGFQRNYTNFEEKKLFILSHIENLLEDVFKNLHWDNRIKRNCQYLNHSQYVDNPDPEELQRIMEELDRESTKIGLKINYSKTKTITNQQEKLVITVAQETSFFFYLFKEYIYLGQRIKPNKEKQT